jgi:hypothetical protein
MPLLLDRLEAIPELRGKFRVLSSEEIMAGLAVARKMFPAGEEPTGQLVASRDISDDEYDHVRAWLRQLGLRGRMTVIWITPGRGIEIDYDDFIPHFDDFWYPGDDVWAISDHGQTILAMDHEEILSLYRH